VKSFASGVLGWHWGWKVPGSGLPVQLSARTPVKTHWACRVTDSGRSVYDVAYDLWLHGTAAPTYSSTPKAGVMVWLARAGGAGLLGAESARLSLDGAMWDLYVGSTDTSGWPVYSFVKERGTTDARYDLQDFLQALVRRGHLNGRQYLSSVEAGTEVFTSAAHPGTSAYSAGVG
jgi:hypothetical protein